MLFHQPRNVSLLCQFIRQVNIMTSTSTAHPKSVIKSFTVAFVDLYIVLPNSSLPMYRTLNCLPLSARRHYHWLQCIFKCIQLISNNIQHYTYPHTLANRLRILTFLVLKLTKNLAVMLFNSKHLLTRTICQFKEPFAIFVQIFGWIIKAMN